LERKFETFPDESVDTLINHGLQALIASLQEGELSKDNCTIGIVGADMQFTLIEGEALLPYLAALKEEDIGEFPPHKQQAGSVARARNSYLGYGTVSMYM